MLTHLILPVILPNTSGLVKLQPTAQIHPCCLFSCSSGAKNGLYIFKWLKIYIFLICDKWKLHEIQITVSINKVLLAPSHAHLFMYCVWMLSHYNGRVELWQTVWPKIFIIRPLIEKGYWCLEYMPICHFQWGKCWHTLSVQKCDWWSWHYVNGCGMKESLPVLQMRKPQCRKVKELGLGHPVSKWRNQDLNQSCLIQIPSC